MDSKMKAILDGTPDSPTRSKLEPYRELIRGLRQKRKTFPEIAQVLLTNYNVHIHPSNIHRFVKIRSKKQRSQFEIPPTFPSTAPVLTDHLNSPQLKAALRSPQPLQPANAFTSIPKRA